MGMAKPGVEHPREGSGWVAQHSQLCLLSALAWHRDLST